MGYIERCQVAIELSRVSSSVQQDTRVFDSLCIPLRQLNRFKCTVVPYIVRSFDVNIHNQLVRKESAGPSRTFIFSGKEGPFVYPSPKETVSQDQTYPSQSSKLDLWLHRMVTK